MFCNDNAVIQQGEVGEETQTQHQTEGQKEQEEITDERSEDVKPPQSDSISDSLSERIRAAGTDYGYSQSTSQQTGISTDHIPPPTTHSVISLESITHGKYFHKYWEMYNTMHLIYQAGFVHLGEITYFSLVASFCFSIDLSSEFSKV